MELARHDTILKYSALHLHKRDRNQLKRSGYASADLFSPSVSSVLNRVENKYQQNRYPRDNKRIFNSRIGCSNYGHISHVPPPKTEKHALG